MLLAKLLSAGGNVLLLDEPTNDLDLMSLRVLEEALLGLSGAVLDAGLLGFTAYAQTFHVDSSGPVSSPGLCITIL